MAVQSADALTPQELQGRQIYQQSQDESNVEISVTLGLTKTTLPAQTFPCINCHGAEGEGKVEGSLTIPAITASSLFANATLQGRSRPAYNEGTLTQAIRMGYKSNSQSLDSAMPRYSLSKAQMAALIAYLKRLGSAMDLDPGLTDDKIQLGSVLPLSGALRETGRLLKNTLEACLDEANAQGLIYGRRLSIYIEDSGDTDQGALTATQHLLDGNKTFALIARFDSDNADEVNARLAKSKLPDLAPITFMPNQQSETDTRTFYFLPSYADQARALVDYWLTLPEFTRIKSNATLALIIGDHAADKLAAESIRAQAYLQGMMIDVMHWQSDKSKNNAALKKLFFKKPAAIFFLGDVNEFETVNAQLIKTAQHPMLLGLMAMLGREALQIKNLSFSRILLATPFAYDQSTLNNFTTLLKRHGIPLQNPGLQSIACNAVKVLVEGLKHIGRHASRQKLITALEEIHNFPSDFLPPLNFSSHSKIGLQGAYIMELNQRAELISQSTWITPSNESLRKP
ncbi:MAG: ABC transporter substrate-binding protein [Methylococcales bacterium]